MSLDQEESKQTQSERSQSRFHILFKNIYFYWFVWLCWVVIALWEAGSLVVICKLLVEACGLQLPDWGSNPGPLRWEHGVLAFNHQGSPEVSYVFKWGFIVFRKECMLWDASTKGSSWQGVWWLTQWGWGSPFFFRVDVLFLVALALGCFLSVLAVEAALEVRCSGFSLWWLPLVPSRGPRWEPQSGGSVWICRWRGSDSSLFDLVPVGGPGSHLSYKRIIESKCSVCTWLITIDTLGFRPPIFHNYVSDLRKGKGNDILSSL